MVGKRLIKLGIVQPKKLFLIDGLGALLSAFLLGIVLVRYQSFFGIPINTLYLLAALPCLFALYDLYSFLKSNHNVARKLMLISKLNLFYCLLSIGLAIYHIKLITLYGWLYLLIEISIVIILARIEYRIAKALATQ